VNALEMKTALLFDLDGTLVDTDAEHLLAFQRVFAPYGIALDRALYTQKIMGFSNDLIARDFLAHLTPAEQGAILDAKEVAYRDNIGELHPLPGVVDLLAFADAHGLKRAVVTNAPRANADLVLSALGLNEQLPIRVIGVELERAKPDPLPYLTGLARTGASAAHSVAFEDSRSGVRSAAAAGLAVVGVTTSLDESALVEAGATIAIADYTDSRVVDFIRQRMMNGGAP
jgi:HAD superfamily hydrolase (TIGR01509 family)